MKQTKSFLCFFLILNVSLTKRCLVYFECSGRIIIVFALQMEE